MAVFLYWVPIMLSIANNPFKLSIVILNVIQSVWSAKVLSTVVEYSIIDPMIGGSYPPATWYQEEMAENLFF